MKLSTKFAHIGRPHAGIGTAVNPDITRASTLLFESCKDLYRTDIRSYGRHGSDVHDALEACFNTLENGHGTSLTPSGLSACTLAILSFVKPGDHVLLTDSVYGPTRYFCMGYLKTLGIETELYDPNIGAGIDTLIRDTTALIILESPGSLTFEIQDIPAITKAAKHANVTTIIDNTWSAGLSLKPLDLGVDISVHAATKYLGGHSDIMFGAVTARTEEHADIVSNMRRYLGLATSPDDAYQILRGFRTLKTRFDQQAQTALTLAKWLNSHSNVKQVLHPALPTHPHHALWQRDFTGGACLFGLELSGMTFSQSQDFIDGLKLFGIGFSYGGYESVAIPCDPQLKRKFMPKFDGPLVRLGCGLEDADDLINDLKQSFERFN